MKITFTVFFLFSFIGLSLSQSNFRPGYIITNELDTIYGQIDYRSDSRNMKVCLFSKEGQEKKEEYRPGQIHGYRFTDDRKFYVSKYLNLDEVQDTVFVEYLLKGITDLYYYREKLFYTYLLEDENGQIYELSNDELKLEKKGKFYLVDNNRYLGILNHAFEDSPELSHEEIFDTKLTHKSLINITKKYHEYVCDGERCIIYEKEVPVLKVELMPAIGYSVSDLKFRSFLFSDLNMEPSFSPYFGLGLNWKLPRLNEKLSILTNFVLREDYYFYVEENRVSGYSSAFRDYHLFSTNMTFSLALKYTYPKGKIVPTFYAGGTRVFEIDENFTLWEEIHRGEKINTSKSDLGNQYNIEFQAGFICGAGIEFPVWGRHVLFSNVSFSQTWGWDYTETIKNQRIWGTFSVGYIF